MTSSAVAQRPVSGGPWLWSAPVDLALFGGSALFALALLGVGRLAGLRSGAFPEWGFVLLILGIDVAHVYSTLFRTYLDRDELRRYPVRYTSVPLLAFLLGVALYQHSPLWFWRVLAYAALFHFVRQQVGWVAIYRARAGQRGLWDRFIDEACVYSATLYPVLYWHGHLASTRFSWFIRGDFVDIEHVATALLPIARVVWVFSILVFCARQVQLMWRDRVVYAGKGVVVCSTILLWYLGIVATNSDFEFTVTNVIAHGVPYLGLLWAFARARSREAPELFLSRVAAGGVGLFLGFVLVLAFVEEFAWDRLVNHSRPWLFGESVPLSEPWALTLLVPLLAVPQATHYALDALLWRRKHTRELSAQRRAFGF